MSEPTTENTLSALMEAMGKLATQLQLISEKVGVQHDQEVRREIMQVATEIAAMRSAVTAIQKFWKSKA